MSAPQAKKVFDVTMSAPQRRRGKCSMGAPQAKQIFDERSEAERSEPHFCNFCNSSRLPDALNLQKRFCSFTAVFGQYRPKPGSLLPPPPRSPVAECVHARTRTVRDRQVHPTSRQPALQPRFARQPHRKWLFLSLVFRLLSLTHYRFCRISPPPTATSSCPGLLPVAGSRLSAKVQSGP